MWPADQNLRSSALDLYGAVWKHVPKGILQAREWGADWFEVSTPFLVRSENRLLAHAGVISCQLSLAGQRQEVAAVHGVCVHPEHRGQGLGRQVLEAALDHIDRSGASTTILWSEKVDLYRKFGFEATPEHVFVAKAPKAQRTEAFSLDLQNDVHRELLFSTLCRRRNVSQIVSAADDGWHFLIDLAFWAEAQGFLVALPEFDAILVGEVEGPLLRIYDLLASEIPPCSVLVGATQSLSTEPIERLEIYFTSDLLDVATETTKHPFEDLLMVRGKPLVETSQGPFALSPFTRT